MFEYKHAFCIIPDPLIVLSPFDPLANSDNGRARTAFNVKKRTKTRQAIDYAAFIRKFINKLTR